MMHSTATTGMKTCGGKRSTLTTWRARTIPMTHMAMEARNRMAVTCRMKFGCSMESIGPGVTPWSMRAPSSIAAGGLPGIPRLSRGMMAPPMQELLAVSVAITPS